MEKNVKKTNITIYKYIYLLLYKKYYNMSRIIKVITEEENIQPPYLYIVKKATLHNIKNIIVGKKLAARHYFKAQDNLLWLLRRQVTILRTTITITKKNSKKVSRGSLTGL